MSTSIRFTARDTVVDGEATSRQSEAKSDRILIATALKTALFGPKKKGK